MGSAVHVIIRDEVWRKRLIRTGEVVECESFHDFLIANPLRGLGLKSSDIEKLGGLLKDKPETEVLFRAALTGVAGGDRQSDKSINDNVMNASSQGNQRAYTLSRLSKQRPDLFERVVSKELSAHAAAIEAGFRKKKTPWEQIEHWLQKLSSEEWQRFKETH